MYIGVGPADGATDGAGGKTSGHAASRLVHGSQVDLGGGEIITINLGVKNQVGFTRVNCLTCDFICQTTQVAISHEKTKSSQLMAKNTWFEVKRCQIYLD